MNGEGNPGKLTYKQKRFVQEYCTNPENWLDEEKAYRAAYGGGKHAKKSAKTLMEKPEIRKAVADCLAEAQDGRDLRNRHVILHVLETIIRTNPADLFTDDGSLRPVSSLGERAHCIASVIPGAGGKALGTLVPKIKAIELYAKYLNLVRTEAPQVNILPVVEVVPKSGSAEEWNGESGGQ